MATRNQSTRVAAAQDVGGAPGELQTDRVRAAVVRSASGARVLLAVIADGSGPSGAEAAARVVEQVFQLVQASRTRELSGALQRGLEIADQGLRKSAVDPASRPQVSATAVLIRRGQMSYAHCGHTFALLVSQGRATPLTQADSSRLGGPSPPNITTGGRPLRGGDRLVLASDGLMRRNSLNGGPYVTVSEIAEHASRLPPREASRHLVSLALGRDVDDNVSVAVLVGPGRAEPRQRYAWPIAAAAMLLVGLAGVAAISLLRRPGRPPTTEFGFAVLVEGGAAAGQPDTAQQFVPSLGTIPGGSNLTAATDARLGLQSTIGSDDGVSQVSLFLHQSSALELSAIDPRTGELGGPDPGQPLGTDLVLPTGRILVLRESGTWEVRVDSHGFTASLIGAGHGAMGVASSAAQFTIVCLDGTCRLTDGRGGQILLQEGQMVTGTGGAPGEPVEAPPSELAVWDALCGGCVSGSGWAPPRVDSRSVRLPLQVLFGPVAAPLLLRPAVKDRAQADPEALTRKRKDVVKPGEFW